MNPLERQRRAREAKLWVEDQTGLGMLLAKLPAPQFNHLRQAIDRHYMVLLRRDGSDGRDPDSLRSPKQRMADAVLELVTNRDAYTGEFIEEMPGVKAKASTQVILVAPFGLVDGTNPQDHVEMIGVGPVPREILGTLTPDTELAGMIFDRAGRPLWLGRNQRLANAAQRLAVAVRDGGCFECGAPMHRCELHHIREWHRDGGRTDIDNTLTMDGAPWSPCDANTTSGSKPRTSWSSVPPTATKPDPETALHHAPKWGWSSSHCSPISRAEVLVAGTADHH